MADPKKEEKQDESFKVIDRRLFSSNGEIRDEAVRDERHKQDAEPPRPSSPIAAPEAPAKKPGSPSGLSQPPGADNARAPEPPTLSTADAPDAPKPSRGLQMLINFVAQNAAMLLGAYPDSRTGEAILDMEGARELVDMLDALREATRNNLAAEDERLLIDVLGSLKLSYMEMTKAAAKAMKEKAKAHP